MDRTEILNNHCHKLLEFPNHNNRIPGRMCVSFPYIVMVENHIRLFITYNLRDNPMDKVMKISLRVETNKRFKTINFKNGFEFYPEFFNLSNRNFDRITSVIELRVLKEYL